MITIRIKDGEEETRVICDECGNGFKWDHILLKTRITSVVRKQGWIMGKRHICDRCKEVVKKNGID